MRITVKHEAPAEGITLPVSYHHILQAMIYAHMKGTKYETLHDKAYEYEKRAYKMFTFSELFGKYKIQGTKITFYGRISLKIASPNRDFIECIGKRIAENGMQYGEQKITDVRVTYEEDLKPNMWQPQMKIRMISPVCIYSTDKETGKTYFYEPGTIEFTKKLEENFARKYKAFYGKNPIELPTLKPMCVLPKHKRVTEYKGFMITGWMGDYILLGTPEYLAFWSDVGLGGKNAQGFGMFEWI